MCLHTYCNTACLYWSDFIIWCTKLFLPLSIALHIACWMWSEIIDDLWLLPYFDIIWKNSQIYFICNHFTQWRYTTWASLFSVAPKIQRFYNWKVHPKTKVLRTDRMTDRHTAGGLNDSQTQISESEGQGYFINLAKYINKHVLLKKCSLLKNTYLTKF